MRLRTRECDKESHGEYGVFTLDCIGDDTEELSCNDFKCVGSELCCDVDYTAYDHVYDVY